MTGVLSLRTNRWTETKPKLHYTRRFDGLGADDFLAVTKLSVRSPPTYIYAGCYSRDQDVGVQVVSQCSAPARAARSTNRTSNALTNWTNAALNLAWPLERAS
jgi:hypothetical protein